MSAKTRFSHSGIMWRRAGSFAGRAAASGFDGNIIYTVIYSVISNVAYDVLRKLRIIL